jgi:TPR repeat protein
MVLLSVAKRGVGEGTVRAQVSMGRRYLQGHKVEKNRPKGEEILRSFANQGNARAQSILGEHLLKYSVKASGGARTAYILESEALLRSASNQGNPKAQSLLAILYFDPIEPVHQNIPKALKLLWQAAAQNDPLALGSIGHLCMEGKYVPQDVRKGLQLLEAIPEDWREIEKVDLVHQTMEAKSNN